MRKRPFSRYFWVLGGLALGGFAALVTGLLVFWVFPAVQRARSPVGEYAAPPVVLRFLKASPLAGEVPKLAVELGEVWGKTLKSLGLSEEELSTPIYLYVYASPAELAEGLASRQGEERTILAVADVLVNRKVEGELGRLACSLAFGRPGNPLIPRGVALYLNDPQYPWAAEAWVWMEGLSPRTIWWKASQALPKDPWEDLYFQVNAPWTEATVTLEKMRVLLETFSQASPGKTRVGELFAGTLVQWILLDLGGEGLRQFWKAGTWDKAAIGLGKDPDALEQNFLTFLRAQFFAYERRELLLARKEVYSGRAEAALRILTAIDDEEAQEIRGVAYLALGKVGEAVSILHDKYPDLEVLGDATVLDLDRLVLVDRGSEGLRFLQQAAIVLERARLIWPDLFSFLPDRLTFYVAEPIDAPIPWGTVFLRTREQIPEAAARLALEAVGSEAVGFDTLVEGMVLWLTQPERDFRQEAQRIRQAGRWVSLTQPLFSTYSREIAEGEAGALAVFLLERYGPDKFRGLWATLKEGQSIFRASELALGLSFYALEQELLSWIRQL